MNFVNKTKKLVIVGIGSIAKSAYEYFKFDSPYDVVGFCVNKDFMKEPNFMNLPVTDIDFIEQNYDYNNYEIFVAIGDLHLNKDRERLYKFLKNKKYKFATYVSSNAFVWHNVKIGENCLIMENNVLQHDVEIGNNVIMWSGNHVGHFTKILDNCFISSHVVISGYTIIGKNSFIGVNSSISNNITIGDFNFIGLGSIINKSTDENSVYISQSSIKSIVSAKRFCKVKD